MSALAVIILLALSGAGLLVAGVFVLLGLGFSLVLGGLLLLVAAYILRAGLTNG